MVYIKKHGHGLLKIGRQIYSRNEKWHNHCLLFWQLRVQASVDFSSANMEAVVSDVVAPEDLKVNHFLSFNDCKSKMTSIKVVCG